MESKEMVYEYKTNEQGFYVCTVCSVVKEKQNTMHYHMKKHEGNRSYECESCDKKFYQKYALDDHIKLHHSTEPLKEIKCPFDNCIQTFIKKEHCRIHIARNHLKSDIEKFIEKKKDSKIHACLVCKREFNSYPAILYHAMDHMKDDTMLKEKLKVI
jgi:KRAB domain-containing zinc finger protein